MGFLAPFAGAIGSIGGSIIGSAASSGNRDAAQAAYAAAMREIQDLGLPPDQSAPIIMKHFESAGILTPEVENAIKMETSKVAGIKEDPRFRDAQMKALSDIQKVASTGLRPEDRAALAQVRGQAQRGEEAKRQQIIQNMQARGLGGAGSELAQQLASNQGSAESEEMGGLNVAGQASQRALEAMRQSGVLGGQIRGQEFDIEKTKAGAEDELGRFNIQNQRDIQMRNIASKNRAQESNLANTQDISNKNTAMANNEQLRQREAQRQYWLDKSKRAQMMSDLQSKEAGRQQEEAGRKQQGWAQIGSTVGQGLQTALGGGTRQQQDPTPLSQEEIEKNLREGHGGK